ncbi:MAG: DUF4920 domain-containing protein [Saprospiraceae bacterium]|nr:DUF4920 domain-containing protein [Saprospiraceae bacterium]
MLSVLKTSGSVLALFVVLAACNSTRSITGQTFGEPISAKEAISYDDLLKKLDGKDSLAVKVRGTVEGVCQAKGCWMNIVSAKNPSQESMFVKFKDYGFFMPKDIAGREVIMQGYAYREVTPVDELKHYAEDEGKSLAEIDAITQPKVELKFMASGVMLVDQAPK